MKKKFSVLCVGVTLLLGVGADTLSLDGSDCVINVDSGTKSITSIVGTKSKIVKTGGGVLELAVKSDLISAIDVQGGTLRFLTNDFVLGDPGSTDLPDVVVSGTGTALVARRPVVFGNLTLGAGTTMSQEALIAGFAADNTTAVLRPAEEPANFPAFSVNGKLTVTGNATVSCPLALSTAGTTEFAVSDGATLTVAELRFPGRELIFDPQTKRFTNCEEANAFLKAPNRGSWQFSDIRDGRPWWSS